MGDGAAGGKVSPADVLEYVLDEVLTSDERWCQGSLGIDGLGERLHSGQIHDAAQVCIYGAIEKARVENGWNRLGLLGEVDFVIAAAISDHEGSDPSFVSIPRFNDDPSTTFEDVRLVLKDAYTRARDAEEAEGVLGDAR